MSAFNTDYFIKHFFQDNAKNALLKILMAFITM